MKTTNQNRKVMKENNRFTSNLLSLKLQLKTLFEDAGGDDAIALLDLLATLSHGEQKVVHSMFRRVIAKLLELDLQLSSMEEDMLKEFEETLYQDIVSALHDESESQTSKRLEVLSGGKTKRSKAAVVDISEIRKTRRDTTKPFAS